MEIRLLKYFLAVATTGSVTKAANTLHITQPTLSRQIMQLEEDLDVVLFFRDKKTWRLTEEGLILKRRAEEVLSLLEMTEMEVHHSSEQVNGTIHIGCGMTKGTEILGNHLKDFLDQYPDVSLVIKNGNTDLVMEKLESGLIDIGVVLDPLHLDRYHAIELEEKERWGLLMPKDSSLAKQSYIEANDLTYLPLLTSTRPELNQKLHDWYQKEEPLKIMASYDMVTQALFLLQNKHLAAVIVEGAVDRINKEGLVFVPFYPEMTSTSYIVWKKYQTFSLTVSRFLDFLKD